MPCVVVENKLITSHIELYHVKFQDIKFPLSLDVFDLCTPVLQQKLIPMRDKFKAAEDKKVEQAQSVGFLFLQSVKSKWLSLL